MKGHTIGIGLEEFSAWKKWAIMRRAHDQIISVAYFPLLHNINLIKKNTNQTNPHWETLYKIVDRYSSKCQVMKNKERLGNCQKREETKETWQLNMMRNPKLDPQAEKLHGWENCCNPNDSLIFKNVLLCRMFT